MEDIFLERFAKLNSRQKEAVLSTDGPIMVIAGPGTGKTELLALRVAHIIREGLALPQSILCLTFTENACLNMRERLVKLIGEGAYRVPIFTFHSFSSFVMGRFPEYFWNAAAFTLADDIVRAEIFESLFKKLPHGHPFASFHPSEGFVYLREVKDRIKHIKTGGYTGAEYASLTEALIKEYEEVNPCFTLWPEGRLSAKRLPEFDELVKSLESKTSTTALLLARSLRGALMKAEEENKTEALSEFKKKYLIPDEAGVIVLKDYHQKEKLLALSSLYLAYEKAMEEKGCYDFDDMILSVSHVLKEQATVRMTLEEEYQYVMIDEFQDTNEAQMNLVRELTSSPYHEGKPNVLVVGDDDQAIYKFQGAEVSHLMRFREQLYTDVKTIVLDKNYRSTSEVLRLSRETILQGKGRLENHFPDIQKELTSENKSLTKGSIVFTMFATAGEEYAYVARKIKELLLSGVDGSEIAILARGHKELRELVPFLSRAEIAHEYQRKANVFEESHVRELITLSEYLSSFMEQGGGKDYLLPTILSFPFFALPRKALIELSVRVKKEHKDWLSAASESADEKVAATARLLIELSGEAKTLPLPQFLKNIIEETPFKDFYFGREKLQNSPDEYVTFLSSLRTFLDAFSLYKEGEMLTAGDVGGFVALHKSHDVPLIVDTLTLKKKASVKLMTAHASKGLEFSVVFILAAHDALWVKGRRGSKVPLPFPLKPFLEPAGDDEDDFLRLFYVAMTRAKHTLSISAHDSPLRFISPYMSASDTKKSEEDEREEAATLESSLSLFDAPFQEDEKEILARLLEGYQMPVTHLQNFCNVTEGGPLYFLEQNLLRFPQPMNASAIFGSAVHKVIEEMVKHKKYNGGEEAPFERLLAFFDAELAKGRLPHAEAHRERERGHRFLSEFYKKEGSFFLGSDSVEVDFSKEGVVVEGAHLTGKIDFLREEGGRFSVIDFKTGDSYSDWDEPKLSDYEKIKLHKYRQQLIVYQMLLVGSKSFKGEVTSLALSFVEDMKSGLLTLSVKEEEAGRMKKLIGAVYRKIVNCDFVDVSSYEKNFKGILAFENDLIEGKI